MDKQKHWWLILQGQPVTVCKNRVQARKNLKNRDLPTMGTPFYHYIGKVIPDPKRRGHGKIVLEY